MPSCWFGGSRPRRLFINFCMLQWCRNPSISSALLPTTYIRDEKHLTHTHTGGIVSLIRKRHINKINAYLRSCFCINQSSKGSSRPPIESGVFLLHSITQYIFCRCACVCVCWGLGRFCDYTICSSISAICTVTVTLECDLWHSSFMASLSLCGNISFSRH